MTQDRNIELPRIVIVGAGFGGLSAAYALRWVNAQVTIIDRRNYHLFQPLLYQVATASLSPAEIAQPIRSIVRGQRNTHVLLDDVLGVDKQAKLVRTAAGRAVPFDYLILATGARHSYFGKDNWEIDAPGIKTVDDATRLRSEILLAFERAEVEPDLSKRAALLTFVIVGGGPTGVELAGAIAELARKSITNDFRAITPHSTRIVLVEAGVRLLPSFPEVLSAEAKRVLEAMDVEVRIGIPVTDITSDAVTLGTGAQREIIPAKTAMWAAGVRASPAGEWLKTPTDRAGRVVVNPDFSTPENPQIFVVGDTAAFKGPNGHMLPGMAPVAKQAGAYVGKLIAARIVHARDPKPFVYRDYGNLAAIGRSNAVADFGWIRLKGFLGWVLWSVAHIYFLIGFRNRFVVAASWAWSYLTYQRGARLITGNDAAHRADIDKAA
jgi:NADH dehydrogenase